MLPVPSAGKNVAGAQRGSRCQALEHVKRGARARKNVGRGKGGEILENTSGNIKHKVTPVILFFI